MNDARDLASLRTDYARAALDVDALAPDPLTQLRRWLDEAIAAHIPEPNAMTLATIGLDGRPRSRIVLIKELDASGLTFFTNYESDKGRELAAHPYAALQFHWVELERQVRIEGEARHVDAAVSDRYFASRPLGSRIGAWASPQSRVIASREVLVAREAECAARFGDAPPRPPHWGGVRVVPDRVEFWQGRPSRLHDRLRYVRHARGWAVERLAP